MADEEFKETSTSADADRKSQKEPARIALPSKPREASKAKQESVGINVPVKTDEEVASGGEAAKSVSESESSKGVVPRVKPPVGFSKPSVPPPVPKVPFSNAPLAPKPPKPPLAAGPVSKPPVVPKPPAPGPYPARSATAPFKPSSPSTGETDLEINPGARLKAPESRQSAQIQVPPHSREVSRTPMKMEQPRSMGAAPPVVTGQEAKRGDSVMTGLTIVALLAAALSFVLFYLAFASA